VRRDFWDFIRPRGKKRRLLAALGTSLRSARHTHAGQKCGVVTATVARTERMRSTLGKAPRQSPPSCHHRRCIPSEKLNSPTTLTWEGGQPTGRENSRGKTSTSYPLNVVLEPRVSVSLCAAVSGSTHRRSDNPARLGPKVIRSGESHH